MQDAAPTVIDNFDNVLVKREVNGVEEMAPLADVMRTHQKTAAADQRLEEATRLLREAEARSRTTAAHPAVEPVQPAVPAETSVDIARGITSALFAGDEEKAQEPLRKAMDARPSTPTPVAVPPVDILGGRWNRESRSKVH